MSYIFFYQIYFLLYIYQKTNVHIAHETSICIHCFSNREQIADQNLLPARWGGDINKNNIRRPKLT